MIKPNSFTSYELTEEERAAGSVFTTLQLQVMQNELANLAEQKLRLEYNEKEHMRYFQAEAYLRGKLDFLTFLLDTDREVRTQAQEGEV